MNKNLYLRNRSINLYNPKEEGLGDYDLHYINANKKIKRLTSHVNLKYDERDAA
tara:strand:+ start:304 stop:465 length:162 start_codon:yes stop_codon:yes gene_type:complete